MHVLMISIDSDIFDKKSAVSKRLIKYAKKVKFLSVIVYTSKQFRPLKLAKNCIAYPTNSKNRFSFPTDALKLTEKVHKNLPVSLTTTQDALATGLVGMMFKRRHKVPLQVQLHGDYINNKWWISSTANRLMNLLAIRVVKNADNIRVVSKRVEQRIKQLVPASRISRFPIYTDLAKFRKSRAKKLSGHPIFLFVGRLSPEKNVPLLIHAFSSLHDFPNAKLIIVGDGNEKSKLQSMAKKSRVIFVGRADPGPYYKSATCLILPSLHEGWGLVAIEAAAAGCPVIMSDVGCAGEIIINNKSGLVFPVNNLHKLMDAMRTITNKKLALKLARNAKNNVNKLPSEAQTINNFVTSWRKTAR